MTVKVDKPDPNDPSKTIPTDEVVIDPVTKKPMIDTEKFKAFIDKQTRVQDVIELINATQEDSTDPEIINKNNEKLNEIARLNLFADLASQYVQAGKANLLKDNLLSLQNLSEKDLEALGYSTANSKNSTYVELSYPFIKNSTVNLNGFVGSAFVFNGKEGNYSLYGNGENNFQVVNVGVTASKNITICMVVQMLFIMTMETMIKTNTLLT